MLRDTLLSADEADMEARRHAAAVHIVSHCGNLQPGERVAIIYCTENALLSRYFLHAAQKFTDKVVGVEVAPMTHHGADPDAGAHAAMMEADLILGLTRMSMAHSRARIMAGKQGARYLSLPDYSLGLLDDPCLLVDFRSRAPLVRKIADAFSAGAAIHVTTGAGTDIHIRADGRVGNFCPGFVTKPGDLGSPPDIEANVSPLEDGSNGVVVVDGSIAIPTIGLLDNPVKLTVRDGKIVEFEGEESTVRKLRQLFAGVGSDKAYVLAECGVGLNPEATLTGAMLTDEGAQGTMHFGFGSNATVGGLNDVPFHLDFVFRNATLSIDGEVLIENGEVRP